MFFLIMYLFIKNLTIFFSLWRSTCFFLLYTTHIKKKNICFYKVLI